ncbi:MAG: rhomboid family intramembrane serine protease [Lentisphaeria bacterium]|nr:rhomboid family intramembrane serine protease [Lentisphaeria bacterium]MDY0176605.1 rhomboid family intramembrane serine protease [Lentisphaeria bacterium]
MRLPVLEAQRFLPWLAVLASQNIDYAIVEDGQQRFLLLKRQKLPLALRELALYERNAARLRRRQLSLFGSESESLSSSFTAPAFVFAAFYFALLLRFHAFVVQSSRPWQSLGLWNAAFIRQGQFWRCITSLTLHADYAHLLGNVFWGCLLLTLAASSLGFGLSLLLMLASGALANLLNAYIFQQASHQALGASTMLFALLGILCARAGIKVMYGSKAGQTGLLQQVQLVLPLLAGLGILSLWGTAAKSDLAGHAGGFLCGLLAGFFSLKIASGFRAWPWQLLYLLIAAAMHILAWKYAMP